MRVLVTGAGGFIGRNILPFLKKGNVLFTPEREELNLFNEQDVKNYIVKNKIEVIVHLANPNPTKYVEDKIDRMVRDSIQMFLSIYNSRNLVRKIIYLGSGAIYDKTLDIVNISEDQCFRSIPKDDYGFGKYVIHKLGGDNVYNFCVFGCYGPGDAEYKFITHCILCCLRNEDITIKQDCLFDYMHVFDLGEIIAWAIKTNLKHNIYNACTGVKVSLLQIAKEVKKQMNSSSDIVILKNGYNKEYTASNRLLCEEFKHTFINIKDGIKKQIEWEEKQFTGND